MVILDIWYEPRVMGYEYGDDGDVVVEKDSRCTKASQAAKRD